MGIQSAGGNYGPRETRIHQRSRSLYSFSSLPKICTDFRQQYKKVDSIRSSKTSISLAFSRNKRTPLPTVARPAKPSANLPPASTHRCTQEWELPHTKVCDESTKHFHAFFKHRPPDLVISAPRQHSIHLSHLINIPYIYSTSSTSPSAPIFLITAFTSPIQEFQRQVGIFSSWLCISRSSSTSFYSLPAKAICTKTASQTGQKQHLIERAKLKSRSLRTTTPEIVLSGNASTNDGCSVISAEWNFRRNKMNKAFTISHPISIFYARN